MFLNFKKLMGFMLNDKSKDGCWTNFFDYIIVDARKPLFFAEGTPLKEINLETGAKRFGYHSGPLRSNRVYSGGK
jgi:5'-nucleotidase